ncbi:MAG: ABC transporter permease subunit [Chloroflexi bacterium]|nr:ABC transporter permease subunit [Chloroflexota bacterium]
MSRLIHGSRVSLSLSLLIILIGGSVGTLLGLVSGYSGKKTDAVIQRGVEVILAMPTILVALVFVYVLGRPLYQRDVYLVAVLGRPLYADS